jgi:hypothetical protein
MNILYNTLENQEVPKTILGGSIENKRLKQIDGNSLHDTWPFDPSELNM